MSTRELISSRYKLIQECSRLEEELNVRRKQNRHVMRQSELEWNVVPSSGLKHKEQGHSSARAIAPELGFDIHNFQSFFANVPAGSSEGAYHMHGEAIKYYVSGKGIEMIGDKTYEVNAGDSVFIPAHVWHGTQNPGPDPLVFFAVTQSMLAVPLCTQPIYKIRPDVKSEE